MADKEIKDLPVELTPADADVFELQKAAGGAGSSKQVSKANVLASLDSEPIFFEVDPVTGPAEVTSGDMLTVELPDGSTKAATSHLMVPVKTKLATVNPIINLALAVTANGAGDNNVRLQLDIKYIATGETTTKADDENLVVDVPITDVLDQLHNVAIPLDRTKIAAGDRISILANRLGGAGPDNFTGKVGLMKVGRFDYQT